MNTLYSLMTKIPYVSESLHQLRYIVLVNMVARRKALWPHLEGKAHSVF